VATKNHAAQSGTKRMVDSLDIETAESASAMTEF
jgi:hypothetical protein